MAINDMDQLQGLFKRVYSDNIERLVPDGVKLVNKIKFSKGNKLGERFIQPVNLTLEHGFTYGGVNGGAFTLNDATGGSTKNAEVQSTELVLRSIIPMSSILRSQNVPEAAFIAATKHVVKNMVDSFYKRLEADIFHGQTPFGTRTGAAAGNTIIINLADWASGLWSGAIGMPVDLYLDGSLTATPRNITSVDLDTRTLTVDGAALGAAASVDVYPKGGKSGAFQGIKSILTTSGSVFGINNTVYNLWKGNSHSNGGLSLSFDKLAPAISKTIAKGMDGELHVVCSNLTWDDMMVDLAAKRSFDASFKGSQMEQGSESLKFHSQNGLISVEPSIYCKEGEALVLDLKSFERVGSSDVTFEQPEGMGKYMKVLDSAHGYDVRAYTDQALFCKAPGRNVIVTSIVNS
jgi:hypothetical protein